MIESWAKCRLCWILVIVVVGQSLGYSHTLLVCCWVVFGAGYVWLCCFDVLSVDWVGGYGVFASWYLEIWGCD